jgi:hypothetical protein
MKATTFAICLVILTAVSCTSFADADYQVIFTNPDGSFPIHIYDDAGVVTAAAAIPPMQAGQPIKADPANSGLDVGWVGGECRRETVVRLEGNPSDLHVSVQTDQQAGLAIPMPVACSAVGILLGLRLSLTTPIDQSAITYEVH